MATRIESAPNLPGRIPAADNNNSGFMLSQGAPALSLVRTEPFVVAQPPVQYTRDAATLMLYRAMDLALASLCLMLLWPLMLIAAILVVTGSRGPIFYSQVRFGRDGAVFSCLKFRTMHPDAERLLAQLLETSPTIREIWQRDRKLVDDPRITACGRFLRRYSIDELPQLFNVLRGEMSIVGPRPLATDEAELYGDAFAAYCSLKPGITGPWQVSGRNQVSFAGRAKLDCDYARTKSITQDFQIILRTVPVVLGGSGY